MLRTASVFLGLAALIAVAAGTTQAANSGRLYEKATVIGVLSGDTVTVRRAGGTSARVRLIGVAAPSPGECFAVKANAATRRFSLGRRVSLVSDAADVAQDHEGRLHRYVVFADGRDLGAMLLRGGYARIGAFDNPFRKLASYRAAEEVGIRRAASVWTCGRQEPDPSGGLRGLADFHSHEFAHLGFGGRLHSHSTNPADPCRAPLPYNTLTFELQDLVREGLFKDATDQGSACYPTAENLAGQQMDDDSLRRAWEYGLRLLVVHAVTSQFLCKQAGLDCPTSDLPAIDAQIDAAYALQDRIDEESGGAGRGWYRIVRTPQQARQVIADGKLAVVLGVESANAFGCHLYKADVIPGIFPWQSVPTWENDCATPAQRDPTEYALALMEHYWERGVRHFFLIHNLDGIAGGTALGTPILHAANNPSRLRSGYLFDLVGDIDSIIGTVRPSLQTRPCPRFDFDGGVCNAKGLTRTGVALSKLAADHGALIDIDHMSLLSRAGLARAIGETYPVISSHSGVDEINHGDKKAETQLTAEDVARITKWGGAFAPILHPASSTKESDTFPAGMPPAHNCGGTTETFIQTYRYVVAKLRSGTRFDGAKPYVGVGFGSDFNGLAGWPLPRFKSGTSGGDSGGLNLGDLGKTLKNAFVGDAIDPPGGLCYYRDLGDASGLPPMVAYPFQSPLTKKWFDRSTLPWSKRFNPFGPGPYKWDISFDGVAHVGMIPDFVEEMRVLFRQATGSEAAADEQLQPLWHGAEAYIQTWERADSLAGHYNPERDRGVLAQCQSQRQILLLTLDAPGAENEQKLYANWTAASAKLRELNCLGTEPEPAECKDLRTKLTELHQQLEALVEKLATLLKDHSGSDDEVEALREEIGNAKAAIAEVKRSFDDAGCSG